MLHKVLGAKSSNVDLGPSWYMYWCIVEAHPDAPSLLTEKLFFTLYTWQLKDLYVGVMRQNLQNKVLFWCGNCHEVVLKWLFYVGCLLSIEGLSTMLPLNINELFLLQWSLFSGDQSELIKLLLSGFLLCWQALLCHSFLILLVKRYWFLSPSSHTHGLVSILVV